MKLLIKKCSQRSRTLFDVHARFALRPNLGASWHVRNIEPTSITEASSTPKAQEMPGISGVGLEARSKFRERNWNVLFEMTKTPVRSTRNASRLWCWAGSKNRLREKLECEMATTPVHSIRKARLWCWARSSSRLQENCRNRSLHGVETRKRALDNAMKRGHLCRC
jgi:hypothetical protein